VSARRQGSDGCGVRCRWLPWRRCAARAHPPGRPPSSSRQSRRRPLPPRRCRSPARPDARSQPVCAAVDNEMSTDDVARKRAAHTVCGGRLSCLSACVRVDVRHGLRHLARAPRRANLAAAAARGAAGRAARIAASAAAGRAGHGVRACVCACVRPSAAPLCVRWESSRARWVRFWSEEGPRASPFLYRRN
jgi:hypothetical protein